MGGTKFQLESFPEVVEKQKMQKEKEKEEEKKAATGQKESRFKIPSPRF